ncbi:uncharacterized protein LOC142923460 isoform X3 [Petromyzon marinus]|uniref:uncharacterized protein LOC142923460 isoform X3 n=1 Tax=Petromyzon marinus TaxID=7757 RepID=UPI003F6EC18B
MHRAKGAVVATVTLLDADLHVTSDPQPPGAGSDVSGYNFLLLGQPQVHELFELRATVSTDTEQQPQLQTQQQHHPPSSIITIDVLLQRDLPITSRGSFRFSILANDTTLARCP